MIDKLDFILALAREKHFGRAAEACGVTQPTLSAGVKQLEEQMGVLLVNRGSRFQSFTPEGERVLDWARRIVGDTRAMREEINSLRHGLSGQLRIAAIPTALAMVAALTTPYRERHPERAVHRSTRAPRSRSSICSTTSRSTPASPISATSRSDASARVPLYHERYRLLTSADAPLGNRDTRDLGRGGAGAALPAHARHAEPPHHRPPAAERGRRVAADAGIGFDDPAVLAMSAPAAGRA